MMPNQNVKGLKGFQKLPLQTSPLELPWSKSTKSTHNLFDGFPANFVKVTSLLEALAVAKRDTKIPFWDEQIEDQKATEQMDVDKNQEVKDKTDLMLHEAETKDNNSAVGSYSFQSSALPDLPISTNNLSPEAESVGEFEESSSLEVAKASDIDTTKEGQETSSDQGDENEEQSLYSLQKQLIDTKRRISAMQKVLTRERHEVQQVEQHILETQKTGQELQIQLAMEKQLVLMLPEAQANIEKLESICEKNTEKKNEIIKQMEAAREPLLKEYAELKRQKSTCQSRRRQLIREIKNFRAEMQEATNVIQSRTDCMRKLEKTRERQLAKLGKKKDIDGGTITRNMYISRIMDIIKQVHKQKQDITKILKDISGLQRKLHSASEKLKRTEAVADDKLYRAASKSKSSGSTKAQSYIECYRKFAQVRELFDELIILVGDVGRKENAVRDLHNWIAQLQSRGGDNHLDKVLADLDSVREENGTLQNKLRA